MAIAFFEWNQRNSHTERRTEVPNLWGRGDGVSSGVGVGWQGSCDSS
jgi:hypothetical protein